MQVVAMARTAAADSAASPLAAARQREQAKQSKARGRPGRIHQVLNNMREELKDLNDSLSKTFSISQALNDSSDRTHWEAKLDSIMAMSETGLKTICNLEPLMAEILDAIDRPEVVAALYQPDRVKITRKAKPTPKLTDATATHSDPATAEDAQADDGQTEEQVAIKRQRLDTKIAESKKITSQWQEAVRAAAAHLQVPANYGCKRGTSLHQAATTYRLCGSFQA